MWYGSRKEAGGAGETAALQHLLERGLKLVLHNHLVSKTRAAS
jgi:hypothetical protein